MAGQGTRFSGGTLSQLAAATWRELRYFDLYRVFVATVFVGLLFSPALEPEAANEAKAWLGMWVAPVYLAVALGLLVLGQLWQRAFHTQAAAGIILDIACLTVLMHALGPLAEGTAVLIVVAVGAGALLTQGQLAIALAALASVAVLLEHTVAVAYLELPGRSVTQAGMFGLAYFATAFIGSRLARRARESAALAVRRGVDLANLAELNELIIQRMSTGILAVDADDHIRLMNESAWYLMGMPSPKRSYLPEVSPELSAQLESWRESEEHANRSLSLSPGVPSVIPRFMPISREEDAGTLVFLEDTSTVNKRAEELNLASLGRLAASIAHEIRNPLGAISHAGQLLQESESLGERDQRLARIITNHCARMNDIVENVLQLSRRSRARPERLRLGPWLAEQIEELRQSIDLGGGSLEHAVEPPDLEVVADPSQLQQVLWNLCHNAIRYGRSGDDAPHIRIRAGRVKDTAGPVLDVVDNGPGVPPANVHHLFEPFASGDGQSPGLGLYIARQLCEANDASLEYIAVPTGGACFRVSFPIPRLNYDAAQTG